MPFEPKTVKTLTKSAGLKIMVYGESGAGKTTLLSTVPDPSRLLILSAESGLRSVAETIPDAAAGSIKSIQDMRDALAYIKGEGASRFDWIGIDSLSEIAKIGLIEEMGKTTNGQKAYGEMATGVTKLVRAFRDLPVNVVFISAQGLMQDENGAMLMGPDHPGKMLNIGSESLPYIVDFCWPLLVKRSETDGKVAERRVLMCQPDGRWRVKSRKPGMPRFMRPDLAEIAAFVQDGIVPDWLAAKLAKADETEQTTND